MNDLKLVLKGALQLKINVPSNVELEYVFFMCFIFSLVSFRLFKRSIIVDLLVMNNDKIMMVINEYFYNEHCIQISWPYFYLLKNYLPRTEEEGEKGIMTYGFGGLCIFA